MRAQRREGSAIRTSARRLPAEAIGEGGEAQPVAATVPAAVKPRGARNIALDIKKSITDQVYGEGQQLPTERQLASSFGASRTTIRKALAILETQKLLERRAGSGTYVSRQMMASEQEIAERTSPLELIEVRAAFEPQMVRLAVLHASARDIDKMQALIRDLTEAQLRFDLDKADGVIKVLIVERDTWRELCERSSDRPNESMAGGVSDRTDNGGAAGGPKFVELDAPTESFSLQA